MENNNFKKEDAGCDKYGTQRLELAVYLRNHVLHDLHKEWFLENGTLLGAWRNGKFIPHDDDFDIAMLIDSKDDVQMIYNMIHQKFQLMNSKYSVRIIDTYASKIEIYDESYGNYTLIGKDYNGQDYHYVTLDIQFYLKLNDTQYDKLYYINPSNISFHINKEILLPVGEIVLEKETFNAPANVEQLLKYTYGSLDPNASYNSKTGFYEVE